MSKSILSVPPCTRKFEVIVNRSSIYYKLGNNYVTCIFLNTTKMDSLTTGSLSGVQKEELMDQVKQQIAIANAQELLTKMSEKCFKKCISKPGTSLDNSEQKCIAMCMDRYMDAWNLVSRTYSTRIQRERNNM